MILISPLYEKLNRTRMESMKLEENFNKKKNENKFICGEKERYVLLFIIGNTYPIRIEKYFQFFVAENNDEKFFVVM